MGSGADEHRAVASQLELGARGYGAGAAERLAEESGASFGAWHGFCAQRVLELSVGVAFDEPALLAGGLAWSAAALRARGVEGADGRRVVDALRGSLRADLADSAWGVVEPHLAFAEAHADGEGEIARLRADGGLQAEALRFLERTLRAEGREAIEALVRLQRAGTPTRDLFERVLMAASSEMGTMWHLGEIGVGEEHAATEAVHAAISVLWREGDRAKPNGVSAVVGSVAEDRHDIGVRATACLLELEGYRAACLGADLPSGDFVQAVRDYDAGVAVIGATMVTHLPRAAETVAALRAARPGLRIIAGGPAFSMAEGLAEKIGADALARSPGEVVEMVGRV